MNAEQNNGPFLKRFYIYQQERFPFLGHGLLISAFSFSAISYSRICRHADGFVEWKYFVICVLNTVTLFFLVRIFDEFKDKEDDVQYRKYLPVPRGLIRLSELRNIGIVVFILQIFVNVYYVPQLFILYVIVIGYLMLMGKEFFITSWLKRNQFWYITSHMFIIPLVDVYASGFDWLLNGSSAPLGLLFFFAVSYMNGIVLEIGRKIKAPENEEPGVLSYTHQLGTKRAVYVWIIILGVTLLLASAASYYAGHSLGTYMVLSCLFLLCMIPAVWFIQTLSPKGAKFIEYASALWTFGMYLTLGGIPMLVRLLFK